MRASTPIRKVEVYDPQLEPARQSEESIPGVDFLTQFLDMVLVGQGVI